MPSNGSVFAIAAFALLISYRLLRPNGRKRSREGNSKSRPGFDAPEIHVRFDCSPQAILRLANDIIKEATSTYDRVASIPVTHTLSYEEVIAPLATLEAESFADSQTVSFPGLVSPSKKIRDASSEAEKKLDAAFIKLSMREDVYRVVKAYSLQENDIGEEASRFVTRMVRDFERNGLNLDAGIRAEVEQLKTRIGELCIDFNKNLNEESSSLLFTPEDLAGLPADFINSLERVEGEKLKVTLKYPHYFPIMKLCQVRSSRLRMEQAFSQRCVDSNSGVLQSVAALRHRLAVLLGHPSHAHYVLDIRMARAPEQVMSFLESLCSKISPLAQAELQQLKSLKQAEDGQGGQFAMADLRYYMQQEQQRKFQVDHAKLKEYFPLPRVTRGLMEIYQRILGLQFVEIPAHHAWHPEVQLFEVRDAPAADATAGDGEVMGYFYLDLFPREGKYGHACVCTLQPGCLRADGSRQLPVCAMLCNFTRPEAASQGRPSLLEHEEVVTFFHEFGHAMHNICARAEFAKFSGTRVERDFVEAPSQMLENWCWEKASLDMMSAHFQDGSSIPAGLCASLVASKRAHAGLLTKRQLFFALFDQILHSQPECDAVELAELLHPKVMEGIAVTQGSDLAASFAHLTGGYDASYYGYLWSEVFSADMFASKFRRDVLSAAVGREYRQKVLQPGGTRDAADILRAFLGREPSDRAFLESKGLGARWSFG